MTLPVAPHSISKPMRRFQEYRVRLTVLAPSGAAQDIAGATFEANVRTGDARDATSVVSLTQNVVSYTGGTIDFSLTETQTGALSSGLDYWISIYVTHPTWTAGQARLELHGKLELVG